MVSYTTFIAMGSVLTAFISVLLLLWGAQDSSRLLMLIGLLVLAGLALVWVACVFILMFATVKAWVKGPTQQSGGRRQPSEG